MAGRIAARSRAAGGSGAGRFRVRPAIPERALRRPPRHPARTLPGLPGLGVRLSGHGEQPRARPPRHHDDPAEPRGRQHSRLRRSGAVSIPAGLPVGAGLLVPHRVGGRGPSHLPPEGRVPHRRRLSLPERVGGVRGGDAPRAAGGPHPSPGRDPFDLQHVFRDQVARRPVSGHVRAPARSWASSSGFSRTTIPPRT